MTQDLIMNLGQDALRVSFLLAGPILAVAMIVGIVVSLLQAVTQINESTLAFIPKILAIGLVLVLAGPWMIDTITHYTTDLLTRFPALIR